MGKSVRRSVVAAVVVAVLVVQGGGAPAGAAAADVRPFSSVDHFVRAQYRDFHGRTPTSSELAAEAPSLNAGTTTAATVARRIAHKPGAADVIGSVTRLYSAYFLRDPDVGGLDYWVGRARAGTSLASMSQGFAGSPEFRTRYGTLTNRGFVGLVYENVLGRPAEPSGLAYWTSQLDAGRTRGWLMVGFSESPEYEARMATTVEVVLAHFGMLRRIPTGAERTAAADLVTGSGLTALYAALLGRSEYAARFPLPGAPGSLQVIAEDRRLVVSWTAASGNGSPVTGYALRAFAGATLVSQQVVSGRTGTLTGLTNGTAYTVAVAAINANGFGPSAQAGPATPAPPSYWTTYQGNASHDGNQPNASVPTTATARWTRAFDDEVSYPVIARGRVFVVVRGASAAGGYGSRLYALDVRTGAVLWGPVAMGGTYYKVSAAWDDGKVYTVNFDGLLIATDEATGARRWAKQLPTQYSFSGPPVVRDGTVYVQGSGSGTTLYAVDAATGGIRWSKEGTDPQSSPVVTATSVIATEGCFARAYSVATGATQWTAPDSCDGVAGTTPALHRGRLYVRAGSGNPDVVLNAASGALLDTFAAGPAPAFEAGRGFAVDAGGLEAFDAATGATLWSQALLDQDIVMAPVVAGGRVYVVGEDGAVAGFDAASGAEVWSGQAGTGAHAVDEWNVSGPLVGMGVGERTLVVAAGDDVVAFA